VANGVLSGNRIQDYPRHAVHGFVHGFHHHPACAHTFSAIALNSSLLIGILPPQKSIYGHSFFEIKNRNE
jgi:hypothetical protein